MIQSDCLIIDCLCPQLPNAKGHPFDPKVGVVIGALRRSAPARFPENDGFRFPKTGSSERSEDGDANVACPLGLSMQRGRCRA